MRSSSNKSVPIRTFTHRSQLGEWTLSICQPDPRLAGMVDYLWFGAGKTAYQRDRILPSGQSLLLINFGPPQYRIEPGPPEVRVPFKDVWYVGLHDTVIDTEAPHGNAMLGVAFSARGSYPWLREPMDSTSNCIIGAADAVGDQALTLRERLLNTPALTARFRLVEHWLIHRMIPAHAVHPAVRWAADRVLATRGRLAVDDLARESGISRRHLSELFRQQIGLTPKSLARVHRFRAALTLLAQRPGQVPWEALAECCGYYDQSHLINDFRRFTGFTPLELARRDRPDAGSIVLR